MLSLGAWKPVAPIMAEYVQWTLDFMGVKIVYRY